MMVKIIFPCYLVTLLLFITLINSSQAGLFGSVRFASVRISNDLGSRVVITLQCQTADDEHWDYNLDTGVTKDYRFWEYYSMFVDGKYMWCDLSYKGHAWINDMEVYNSGDANGGHNPELSIRSDGVYHWKGPSFWEQLVGTEGKWLMLRKADKDFFDWIKENQ